MNESLKPIDINIPKDVQNSWQSIVDIIAKILRVPSALIMRISLPYIEVFRTSNSLSNPYNLGDKEHLLNSGLYCETVINTLKKLLVPNALNDENWKNNPDVKLGMVCYLGFPLLWPNGEPFGTICVLDNKENEFGADYELLISQFKKIIESHLSLIYENHQCSQK